MVYDFSKYKYLFLDRDGVINIERKADYVKNISEFVFEDKALDAISILSEYFDKIVIVTNQRGIGRNKYNIDDLDKVHNYMLSEIEKENGKINQIYFCPDIHSYSINRKPNIGMAFQAQAEFPEIKFQESIIVGNSRSDIQFGNKLGMLTVLVSDKYLQSDKIYKEIDCYCNNLYKFALLIKEAQDK